MVHKSHPGGVYKLGLFLSNLKVSSVKFYRKRGKFETKFLAGRQFINPTQAPWLSAEGGVLQDRTFFFAQCSGPLHSGIRWAHSSRGRLHLPNFKRCSWGLYASGNLKSCSYPEKRALLFLRSDLALYERNFQNKAFTADVVLIFKIRSYTLSFHSLLFLFYQGKISNLPRIFSHCRTHKILGKDRENTKITKEIPCLKLTKEILKTKEFKIRSYSARSDLKNKSVRFSG